MFALGNSLTAGYSDNALFIEGQKCPHEYYGTTICSSRRWGKIPFMSDNIGGFKVGGNVVCWS
jgi:hypothetical protein